MFFAYVENIPFCTESQYESVKTSDFEKKIHKIGFFCLKIFIVSNFMCHFYNFFYI